HSSARQSAIIGLMNRFVHLPVIIRRTTRIAARDFAIVCLACVMLSACAPKKEAAPPSPRAAANLPPALTPELIAENNRGVAKMGQFDYQAAHDIFRKL